MLFYENITKKENLKTMENYVRIDNQNPQKSEDMESTIINAISKFFKVNPVK
jgi:septum formation topological specificity factor MinE